MAARGGHFPARASSVLGQKFCSIGSSRPRRLAAMKAKGGVKKGGQGHERNRKAGPQALGLKRKQKSRDEDAESQSVEKKDRG